MKIALIAFATSTIAVIMLYFFGKPVLDISQGTLSFAKDLIAISIPIISFVVGTYYTRKAIAFQKDQANRIAEIRLWINRSILIPEDLLGIKEVVFGYSVEKGARVFCHIPFIVDNHGKVDAENVHLRVTLPQNMSAHGLTKIDAKRVLGDWEESGGRRKSYEYENYWVIDYVFPRITPGISAATEELVDVTHSSGAEFDVDAVTRDKVPVTVTVSIPLLSEVSVSIWASDTKPRSNSFTVKSYRATDENEIAKMIMRERQKSLGEELRKLDAGEATARARPVDLFRKAMIVIPELRKTGEAKPSETKKHYTAVYVEKPEQSKRWIMEPLTKDGIIEVDLKSLKESRSTDHR